MPEWESAVGRHPRVDEQVLEVLADSSGTLAFNGLRRALKVHPESLVRALRRLERDGVVHALGERLLPSRSQPTCDGRAPEGSDRGVGRPASRTSRTT